MTADLEEQRDFLLSSLRDLEAERAAGELADDDYVALKDDYTARAAAVIRQLQGDVPRPPDRSGHISAPPRWRDAPRTAWLVGALVLAVVSGGAGYAIATSSGERGVRDEATGGLPEGSVDRITRAQELVAKGEILEAVRTYDDLLRDDPENPVALAQRGWLLSRVDPSLVDRGLAGIDRAIAVDPNFPDAHFFRGMILLSSKNEPALAAESFQRALDANPPAELRTAIEQYRDEARAKAAAPTSPP